MILKLTSKINFSDFCVFFFQKKNDEIFNFFFLKKNVWAKHYSYQNIYLNKRCFYKKYLNSVYSVSDFYINVNLKNLFNFIFYKNLIFYFYFYNINFKNNFLFTILFNFNYLTKKKYTNIPLIYNKKKLIFLNLKKL